MSTLKRRKSQAERILAYLKQGRTITQLEAIKLFGCMRLSERIRELEAQGVQIERKWVEEIDTRYMSYATAKEQQQQKAAQVKAIDLFAGLGGWSTGAKMAGVSVLWAANHWQEAVQWHSENHPETHHVCQDLHQARWEDVPAHDIMLASPCCQGHSKARGKASGNPQHDASRSTAWAVVSAAEFHRPPVVVVENVVEFLEWSLFPAWRSAMNALGYQISPHIVDCADLGVPQNRIRVFIVCTSSRAPLILDLPKLKHQPATSFIDTSAGKWSAIDRPGRAKATLERVKAGRKAHGETFLISYYGNTKIGRDISRPIGTITTKDRWAIIKGDQMRMLSANECLSAMSFPTTTKRPASHRLTVHMAGNAVPPVAAKEVIQAIQRAA